MSTIGERIVRQRERQRISQSELAALIGETKQTMYKYEHGIVTNIPLPKLEAIGRALDCSPAWLAGWDAEQWAAAWDQHEPVQRESDEIYDALNADGRRELCRYGRYLTSLEEYRQAEEAPVVELFPEYLTPAAAGYASPIQGEDYVLIPRPDDAPERADFCLRLAGDSMEPYLRNGQRVFVQRGAVLSPFDVGIFYVGGDVFCKQYCPGYDGQLYLLSANPLRKDANIVLTAEDSRGVVCFGKVLTRRLPKPAYW